MKLSHLAATLTLLAAATSCSSDAPAPVEQGPTMPESYWGAGPMADAVDVLAVKAEADGAMVVVKGQVQDFGDLATFRLVDYSLAPCTDQCPTPWDFCCEDPADLVLATINVEFLNGDLPAAWSLKGANGLDHLTEVTVAGKLRKDDAGNIRLEASSIAKL